MASFFWPKMVQSREVTPRLGTYVVQSVGREILAKLKHEVLARGQQGSTVGFWGAPKTIFAKLSPNR